MQGKIKEEKTFFPLRWIAAISSLSGIAKGFSSLIIGSITIWAFLVCR